MGENLKEILAKVKQQREAEKNKKVEVVELEEEKPVFKAPLLPPPLPNAPLPELKQEDPKPNQIDAEKISDEIDILQNNGVFRRELLVRLGNINNNLENLNQLIGGLING